jgi:hypothetical protein
MATAISSGSLISKGISDRVYSLSKINYKLILLPVIHNDISVM